MNRPTNDRQPTTDQSRQAFGPTDADEDAEGHSARVYRRHRGPYPMRVHSRIGDRDERDQAQNRRTTS